MTQGQEHQKQMELNREGTFSPLQHTILQDWQAMQGVLDKPPGPGSHKDSLDEFGGFISNPRDRKVREEVGKSVKIFGRKEDWAYG